MKNLKYYDELQFLAEFKNQLSDYLSTNYVLESNKRVGQKQLDLVIENKNTQHTYIIEVKGRPDKGNLPPEIIPSLIKLKETLATKYNHFIVFSLSHVNERVKHRFFENNIEVFEYEKHKNSIVQDFKNYMDSLETKNMKAILDRTAISLKANLPQSVYFRGGVNSDRIEIAFRYPIIERPVTISVRFGDADGRSMKIPVELPISGFRKLIPDSDDFFSSYNFGFIEFTSPVDLNFEFWVEEDSSGFF
jgi:hypothetical protein